MKKDLLIVAVIAVALVGVIGLVIAETQTIQLSGSVETDYTLNRNRTDLDFGSAKPGDSRVQSVNLTSGTSEIIVTKITTNLNDVLSLFDDSHLQFIMANPLTTLSNISLVTPSTPILFGPLTSRELDLQLNVPIGFKQTVGASSATLTLTVMPKL